MLTGTLKDLLLCNKIVFCETLCNVVKSRQSFSSYSRLVCYLNKQNISNHNLHSNKETNSSFCLKNFFGLINFHNAQTHTSSISNGRYGHRLVKLWEQPEYTAEPLKVYRTGGRLPHKNWKGEIVPGKIWTAKLGGGLDRVFHWVERQRLTAEEVKNEVKYQEKVIKIIEDDNRSGHIALVAGPWKRRWVLCTQNMKLGDLITNSAKPEVKGLVFKDGDAYPLKMIPNGTKVCFVEFKPGKGGQIARSAGSFCTVVRRSDRRTILKMPSKREIHVDSNCVAVIGSVSNPAHDDEVWGSPQRRREYGLRPRSGRHHKKDGRFRHRNLPALPPVVIPDEKVLRRDSDFED